MTGHMNVSDNELILKWFARMTFTGIPKGRDVLKYETPGILEKIKIKIYIKKCSRSRVASSV